MIVQRALRRLRNVRRLLILGAIVLLGLYTLFDDEIEALLSRPCPEPPTLGADVLPEHRAQIEALFASELLYCEDPPQRLATLTAPVYWGSDGVTAVLYFRPESLTGLGVTDYRYGGSDVFTGGGRWPSPIGTAPQPGFVIDRIGRPAFRTRAPEDAGYFFRRDGAPYRGDGAVLVEIAGPSKETGLTERDFIGDLRQLWARLRGGALGPGRENVSVRFSIYPGRWEDVLQDVVNPELADREGEADPTQLAVPEFVLPAPTWYRTTGGLLNGTLWVAGVVTATTPTAVLVPTDATGDQVDAVAPVAEAQWASIRDDATSRLASFTFPAAVLGGRYEARYWADADEQAAAPPNEAWTVEFP